MGAAVLTTEQILARTEYAADCLLAALNQAVGMAVRSPLRVATSRQVIEAVFQCDLRLQDIVEALRDDLDTDGVLVLVLDEEKQTIVAADLEGMDEAVACGIDGSPVADSYCQYEIGVHDTFVVSDARLEPMLKGNPSVDVVPGYLGGVLKVREERVGALCALSQTPRDWTVQQQACITETAEQVSAILEKALEQHLNRRQAPGSAPGAERRRD